jgi:TPR repeat protein
VLLTTLCVLFSEVKMIRKIASTLLIGLLCGYVLAQPSGVGNITAEGVALARERALKGDPNHQYAFATMHVAGAGVPEDLAEAAKWFRLAANQGHAKAQSTLGSFYLSGTGVFQDFSEALKWNKLAAAQGDSPAFFRLAAMHALGRGVAKDFSKAYMWASLAAMYGVSEAVEPRDAAAEVLTPNQLAQAQKMARECQARSFKNCD